MLDVPINLFKPIAASIMRKIMTLDQNIRYLSGAERVGEIKDFKIGEMDITVVFIETLSARSRWTIKTIGLRDIRIGLASFKPRIYRATFEHCVDVEEALMLIVLHLPD